jgi:phosphatidylserine decarboxylase
MLSLWRAAVGRFTQQPRLNFLLTNRIPRRQLTLFMAWFSKLEAPWVRGPSIALWKFFADVDLADARQQRFRSLHECFIRELRPGARPVDLDPARIVSPCDAIVGALGAVGGSSVLQAKGQSYPLAELLADAALARHYVGGSYLTLRLTAGMYHRLHAPVDCVVEQVDYIAGDTWNVNPVALQKVPRLYCRNERAVVRCRTGAAALLTLVPVAAILVASIRLHCLGERLHLRYAGPQRIRCAAAYAKGAELGWFEHGSTVIMLLPPGYDILAGINQGTRVRMGQALFAAASAA